MRGRLRCALLAGTMASAGCGPPVPGPGGPDALAPDASVLLPRLADPAPVYRELGFFAHGEPLPFVASIHFLAGPTADSTLAIFGLSLANRALAFRRRPDALEARYRVEVVFRRGADVIAHLSSDQAVRVGSLQEVRRADESVVFQHFFHLPPGPLAGRVTVRDRNRLTDAQDERTIVVPAYGEGPALAPLVPIYRGSPRSSRAALPILLVNPRATSPQGPDEPVRAGAGAGPDSLRFYLEGYGVAPGAVVYLRAIGADSAALWTDTLHLAPAAAGSDTPAGTAALAAAVVSVSPRQLPLGRLQFAATLAGTGDTARSAVLVTFAEQWAVTNLDAVLSLLRFFGHDSELAAVRRASPAERAARWRAFWRATDPDSGTADNEAIEAYFRRVELANIRYEEPGTPGWMSDRGEVYITLGEPDRVDRSDDLHGGGGTIRWTYRFDGETVVLYFVNDLSLQRFRLSFSSRAEYQRILARVRGGLTSSREPR